jgi:hypothetical protein
LTVEQVAERVDCSRATVNSWLSRGRAEPDGRYGSFAASFDVARERKAGMPKAQAEWDRDKQRIVAGLDADIRAAQEARAAGHREVDERCGETETSARERAESELGELGDRPSPRQLRNAGEGMKKQGFEIREVEPGWADWAAGPRCDVQPAVCDRIV